MPVNGLKSSKTRIFLNQTSLLSYMDLTQHHKSTEFPMFRPSESGSGGVENLLPFMSLYIPFLCNFNLFLEIRFL